MNTMIRVIAVVLLCLGASLAQTVNQKSTSVDPANTIKPDDPFKTHEKPQQQPTPEPLTGDKLAQFREIQLTAERADAAVDKAEIALSAAKEARLKAYQTANTEVLKLMESAGCKGCQLTEYEKDGRKVIGMIRPKTEASPTKLSEQAAR